MNKFNIPALIIALGIAVLGLCIYSSTRAYINANHHVTVRGLSQRTVKSDDAYYTIHCGFDGDNAQVLYQQLTAENQVVVAYLREKGFKEEDITITSPSTNDNTGNYNYKPGVTKHYTVSNSVVLHTSDVDAVEQLTHSEGELIERGLYVTTDAAFFFNGLNDIKPEMIEEATKNARVTAEKFAQDSGSKIGKIQSATQGQFAIFTNSQESDYSFDDARYKMKNVRVVTTVVYELR
ncbi:MAG: SIMPL domain-containing protein [Paludibacteraceae bacterium]|nr:SIMPL domain-containing protein [Paludibacteraceae bacterium]